jgi:hypothetical protein
MRGESDPTEPWARAGGGICLRSDGSVADGRWLSAAARP